MTAARSTRFVVQLPSMFRSLEAYHQFISKMIKNRKKGDDRFVNCRLTHRREIETVDLDLTLSWTRPFNQDFEKIEISKCNTNFEKIQLLRQDKT